MSDSSAKDSFRSPSGKQIAIGSGLALVVALIVLITVIWPAEFCRDPTGVGDLLGITCMSTAQTETIALVDNIGGNEVLREVEIPAFGDPVPLPNPAIAQHETAPPTTRTITVELPAGGQTEIKTVLQKDKVLVFEWETDGGRVYTDFHGHNPEFSDDFWVQYKEDQRGAASGYGSLVAPFEGEHGWFWINLETEPVSVSLTVTGYFDDLIDYGLF